MRMFLPQMQQTETPIDRRRPNYQSKLHHLEACPHRLHLAPEVRTPLCMKNRDQTVIIGASLSTKVRLRYPTLMLVMIICPE